DLARALARRLGLGLALVQEPDFRALITAGPKSWDVALGQVSITAGRRRSVDFSPPYLQADQGVLVRRGLAPPRSIAALRGLGLCVQRATTGAAVVGARVRPATPPRVFGDETGLMQALETGRCDAVVYDAPLLAVLRAEVPLRVGSVAGVIPTGERYGAVLPDASPLTPEVSRAMQGLVRDGTVERLSRRWLGSDVNGLRILR
ncbi:MAG: transporter substrate-binding domain-containing protein, partial [Thermoleophilia bacterium]|nr:transporter substrate-binding domain-containing protein [Thermoleophilia bacterium]